VVDEAAQTYRAVAQTHSDPVVFRYFISHVCRVYHLNFANISPIICWTCSSYRFANYSLLILPTCQQVSVMYSDTYRYPYSAIPLVSSLTIDGQSFAPTKSSNVKNNKAAHDLHQFGFMPSWQAPVTQLVGRAFSSTMTQTCGRASYLPRILEQSTRARFGCITWVY
jgi:hypothetical protein